MNSDLRELLERCERLARDLDQAKRQLAPQFRAEAACLARLLASLYTATDVHGVTQLRDLQGRIQALGPLERRMRELVAGTAIGTNPLGLSITSDDEANAVDTAHVPNRKELRALLEQYFIGEITEATVDRISAELAGTLASRGDQLSIASELESFVSWRGAAWREEMPEYRKFPTPAEMALLIAHGTADQEPTFPQPRPHCPTIFVGTWKQVEPATPFLRRYLWRLSRDGTFRSSSRDAPGPGRRWRIERGSLVIRDDEGGNPWTIAVDRIDDDELVGAHLGYDENPPFRFIRVGRRCR